MADSLFKGIRTALYRVTDMQEGVEWYTRLLGKPPYFNEPFYAGFDINGYELGLQPPDDEPMRGRNTVTLWHVDDIQEAFKRIQSLGAKPHEQPMDVGGGIQVASLLDPWGNVIGIIQEEVPDTSPEVAGVTALGGVFFKSPDPEALKKWYADNLGLQSGPYGTSFRWRKPGRRHGYTVWSPFKQDSDYFGSDSQQHMVNYRVRNLDGLLEKLRANGVEIPKEPEAFDYGKFAWVVDPDGNRIELWEPNDDVYGDMGDEWTDAS